jgi:hypothetical protein
VTKPDSLADLKWLPVCALMNMICGQGDFRAMNMLLIRHWEGVVSKKSIDYAISFYRKAIRRRERTK